MGANILLIEDNEQNRYLITFLLERAGHRIAHAPSGADGLRLAQSGNFDLVLLDIQLPGMDGYEVAQRLRALEEMAHVPIVAVTSYAMAGDREKALAAGCNGYLEKPIDPLRFPSEVESFLSSRGR